MQHGEVINDLANQSDPPITNSPLSCFLYAEDVEQRGISLDGSKLRKLLGWKSQEVFSEDTIREVIEVGLKVLLLSINVQVLSALFFPSFKVIPKGGNMG